MLRELLVLLKRMLKECYSGTKTHSIRARDAADEVSVWMQDTFEIKSKQNLPEAFYRNCIIILHTV